MCETLGCWAYGCKCDLITRGDKIDHIVFKSGLLFDQGYIEGEKSKKMYLYYLRQSLEELTDKDIDSQYEVM